MFPCHNIISLANGANGKGVFKVAVEASHNWKPTDPVGVKSSPDGKYFAVMYKDTRRFQELLNFQVKIFSFNKGDKKYRAYFFKQLNHQISSPKRLFPSQDVLCHGMKFSKDNRYFLVLYKQKLSVWDLHTQLSYLEPQEIILPLKEDEVVLAAEFSASNLLAVATSSKIYIWEFRYTLGGPSGFLMELLLIRSIPHYISRPEILADYVNYATLKFSEDERQLMFYSGIEDCQIFDITTTRPTKSLRLPNHSKVSLLPSSEIMSIQSSIADPNALSLFINNTLCWRKTFRFEAWAVTFNHLTAEGLEELSSAINKTQQLDVPSKKCAMAWKNYAVSFTENELVQLYGFCITKNLASPVVELYPNKTTIYIPDQPVEAGKRKVPNDFAISKHFFHDLKISNNNRWFALGCYNSCLAIYNARTGAPAVLFTDITAFTVLYIMFDILVCNDTEFKILLVFKSELFLLDLSFLLPAPTISMPSAKPPTRAKRKTKVEQGWEAAANSAATTSHSGQLTRASANGAPALSLLQGGPTPSTASAAASAAAASAAAASAAAASPGGYPRGPQPGQLPPDVMAMAMEMDLDEDWEQQAFQGLDGFDDL